MTKRNIVVLPGLLVSRQAIELSRQISKQYKTTFVLDGKKFYPHITLYQAGYPQNVLASLEQKLTRIVKSVSPFYIRSANFSTFRGFLFLNIHKNKEIVLLQESIFSALGPLSNSMSPLAGDAFVPHITITRLQNPDDSKSALPLLGKIEISHEAHSLCLANIGPDGTVNEIFKEFPFQMI